MNLNRNLIYVAAATMMLTGCFGSKRTSENTDQQTDAKVTYEMHSNVPNVVYYGFDKYNILPEAQDNVKAQATLIVKENIKKVKIEGHADERGTLEYNITLGNKRATSHRDALISEVKKQKGMLSKKDVETVSFGKTKPVVPNANTEEEHAQNRRSTLVIE